MTPKRIVVLSGSATGGMLYRHLFERAGAVAEVADSPEAACGLVLRNPPDAVLLDAGGEAAARALRAVTPAVLVVPTDGAPPAWPDGLADVHAVSGPDPDGVAAQTLGLLRRREAAPDPGEVFRRSHLLIVDDSVTYREYLRLELEEEGAAVAVASDAAEALRVLAAEAFDCVIVDLVMPGIGGEQLCASLDRLRRRRGLFFQTIVLTSQESDGQLCASLRAGADDFVGKSHAMEVVKMRLMALLRRKHLAEDTLRRRLVRPDGRD